MEDFSKTTQSQADPEDLTVEYANNSFFIPNIWDIKVLFGELGGLKNAIEWHTSITMPWAHAKLMSHYLTLQLAAYEMANGKIKIPSVMIPRAPDVPTEEQLKSDPNAKAFYDLITEHHKRFVEEQK